MIKYYQTQYQKIEELPERTPHCWINISPPFNQEELELLAQDLQIPYEFFSDSLDIDERSRYEIEDDVKLIVVKTPVQNEQEIMGAMYSTIPIGIVLTDEHLITISSYENWVIDKFLSNKVKGFNPQDKTRFVLQIMQNCTARFLNCLKDLNQNRNRIEAELYHTMRNEGIKDLLGIEKSLVFFVTSIRANELLMMKMHNTNLIGTKKEEEFSDMMDDILIDTSQALEMANTYTNILSGTMDAYASIISNNLNVIIQQLTIITIGLMVPNLVFSFFGMNLHFGLENQHNVIWLVLCLSILATLSLLWVFRQKRMF
jgi:magnesium transporter